MRWPHLGRLALWRGWASGPDTLPEPDALPTVLFAIYDLRNCAGQCDDECYDAEGPECGGCICGGRNHGVGKRQAISNTFNYGLQWLDRAVVANPSINAANILPDERALALMEDKPTPPPRGDG
jgi:hypothetical protein